MQPVNLSGTHEELWDGLEAMRPGVRALVNRVFGMLGEHYPKRETRDYEAALLYVMAEQYNAPGAQIAEVGTCWGWTAAIMQHAAPLARVMTCTPNPVHVQIARRNLKPNFPKVEVYELRSVDWLPQLADDCLDMVFIDGDHQRVTDDLPFYNKLRVGGLKIHHDYCPEWSTGHRPCRWVYNALNDFAAELDHEPDVLLVDHHEEGVAGWYKREGEVWMK
jgi:predicted O-methyltransferase YrrM